MFASIKWKFIVVYFLLVFIAMVIVGVFIVERLETQQIENVMNNMEKDIEAIVQSSSDVSEDDWSEIQEGIQRTLNDWRLGSKGILYVIYDEEMPTIIASTSRQKDLIGSNAFSYKTLDPTLILKAYGGDKATDTSREENENTSIAHLAYPVLTEFGQVKGLFYMTSDLQDAYNTVNASKRIFTNATLIALSITVLIGYVIASSITEPIRDVTKKAEEMARGNLDQYVEVKSDDEIGQLASMFNYLNLRLNETLQQMDLEKSKLDTIFNYMAEGVIAVDIGGNVIHANPIATDILNIDFRNGEDLGKDINDKFYLESIGLNDIDYSDEKTLEGERNLNRDSEVYKMKYAPYKNEKNNIGGLIIVLQDITKEHKLDNMRKEFVANVSHELKTPITTIKSYTETLIDGGVDEDTTYSFLKVIENECDRMGRLVRDLLQLSNFDYKNTKWEKKEVSIESLLNDILLKLDLTFKENSHVLLLDIEEKMPNINIDRDGMEQVLLNIIYNSIKYTKKGGEIRIKANIIEDHINIEISDNGIGIPKEDQERIFERFYRVEKGRSREMGGTGLGLSIAKQIVSSHGGEISLESEFGKGTSINIKLPYLSVI